MLEALGSFVVSFLTKFLLEWLDERNVTAGDREIGRLRSELDHALEALQKQQQMAEIAARLSSRADVLARLDEGSA
ncbi:MAG: hypothetical protein KF835_03315 [Xanthobacteraceae bacterium]|nr:hypothetical protein [Xanthobacteraceae bacterium]